MKNIFITFTFDGCYQETIENIMPIIEKFECPVTFYPVVGSLGGELEGKPVIDRKTLLKIKEKKFIEIGSHSMTHSLVRNNLFYELLQRFQVLFRNENFLERIKKLTLKKIKNTIYDINLIRVSSIDDKTFIQEAQESKIILEKIIGKKIYSFAYPGGRFNNAVKKGLQKIGYISARTTLPGINLLPVKDAFELKSMTWTNRNSLQDGEKWIEELLNKGGWLIETFHLVTKNNYLLKNYPYAIHTNTFLEHFKYILKRKMNIIPQGDLISIINS